MFEAARAGTGAGRYNAVKSAHASSIVKPAANTGAAGGIDAANVASLRMHSRLGFAQVAHFREVGHKFGRWLDLVFMQRFLDAPGTARP